MNPAEGSKLNARGGGQNPGEAVRRGRWAVWILGGVLLGAQVAGVVASRFTETRYFGWAPYDEITEFDLRVRVGGRELSGAEAAKRYRLPSVTRDNRSWAHVPAAVAQYERTLGRGDGARVEYRHRVNGGEERVWRWPEDAR